jgi:peptide/nickel transport system substrate-binding protein
MTMRRAALALLAALGACSGEAPASSGKTLIWSRGDDSRTLDPGEIEFGDDAKISENLFETLVAYRNDSVALEPRLATSWTFSPDGRTLTFELREGVVFHDGTAFDAEDVVFTFRRLTDPAHPRRPRSIPYASSFEPLADVKADGPRRVVFTLKAPSVVVLHSFALFGAAIVPTEAVAKEGERFGRAPVGTGPYRLARWDKDVKIELRAFDRYWGPKPAVATVIVVPVASPQTAVEKLKRGETHVVDHPTLSDVLALQKDPAVTVASMPGMNVVYLAFNLKAAPYSHPDFRRAVGLALDRAELNRLVFHGQATPARNLVPPTIWGDTSPEPPYEESLEQAKAHLARVSPPPGEVEILYMTRPRPYNPEPQRLAEALRDQLARLGLKVRLSGYDRPAFEVKYKETSHAMYVSGWNADIPDADNFFHPLLHGDSAAGLNGSFFDDDAFDRAVTDAQGERDPAKRRGLLAAAFARYRAELPTIPLFHLPHLVVLRKGVRYAHHPIEYRFFTADLAE